MRRSVSQQAIEDILERIYPMPSNADEFTRETIVRERRNLMLEHQVAHMTSRELEEFGSKYRIA